MEGLIGPGEAGRRLGVSTRTIQRWLRSGRLPSVRVGARLKVPATALLRGAATGTVEARPMSPLASSTGAVAEQRPVRRLLVANRGELVVRIARTCRSLEIETLALVTPDQGDAWWVRAADETVALLTGYLDGPAIVEAARAAGADAVHPGYGFLAEQPAFAEAVIAAGLTWVGPAPAAMRALGDKAAARHLAARAGVPILPGHDGRGQSDAVLRRAAGRIGYPVLVKPSAGGGGKGMHVVRAPTELRDALAAARREAAAAFADDRLILEHYLHRPRHLEVQVLLDANGAGIYLGERDCSLQRRHQKVVEEAPAPGVDAALREQLGGWALGLARAAGYVGAGTAEFLLADDGSVAFLEMNARLQVEHPVTEAVTGIDLVAAQLRVAGGEPLWLRQSDLRIAGHAIEARLYAEDPWNGFLPAVGRVRDVRWPSGPGLRVDAGIGDGDEIGTRYDPLLAKVIAVGQDRDTALARLGAALEGTRIVGVTTNRGFLTSLLTLPEVVAGSARTETIDARWHPEPDLPDSTWETAARTLAALEPRGFRLNGPRRLAVEIEGQRRSVVIVDAPTPPIGDAWPDGDGAVVLDVDGRAVRAIVARPPSVDEAMRAAHHGSGSAAITAPMPGVVLGVRVREGDAVDAHQVLVVLEAMKMENAVSAPVDGIIDRILVRAGQAVQRGDVLVELAG